MISFDTEFETVIGLEVHVQLATESKIFSKARARVEGSVSDESPNTNTTPVCAAHPGTLPTLNKTAVEYAVRAGLATHCTVHEKSVFSRKQYFYPDLPKGYQISQHDQPICTQGFLDIELDEKGEQKKRVGITRIHMEEDAGKSVHMAGFSLVNLNRAGTPLVEIVSEPDLRSAAEAGAYLRKLYGIVTAIGICDGNLQEGNFRCDANVSIRPKGQEKFGTRTEIKNVNSFRFVEKAIEYEAERQRQVILSGEKIVQETRLYDSQKNQTFSMRTKEDADDYRYFPDPDLLPLRIDAQTIEAIRAALPELPDAKRDRFISQFGLNRYDATLISSQADYSRTFESALALSKSQSGKVIANLLSGEVTRLLGEEGIAIEQSKLKPQHLADIADAVASNGISSTAAKQVLSIVYQTGSNVAAVIEEKGLKQVSDLSAIEPVIVQIINANPKQVEEYRAGKEKVLGFFVGQVMKATQGKANPTLLQELVIKKLKGN